MIPEEEVEEEPIKEGWGREDDKNEKKEDRKADPDSMDAEPNPPSSTCEVKKQVPKADLLIIGGGISLDLILKNAYKEKEAEMTMDDKLAADTEDRRNALGLS
jgi:hypothetical protein